MRGPSVRAPARRGDTARRPPGWILWPRRRNRAALLLVPLPAVAIRPAAAADEPKPISLHPENGHYFSFRGRPTVLITSGEHYGAVLNADFDYVPYLDE